MIAVVVTEVEDCLKAEKMKQVQSKVGAWQACLHLKKINQFTGKIGTQLWRQRLFIIFQPFLNRSEDFLTTKAAQHPSPSPSWLTL